MKSPITIKTRILAGAAVICLILTLYMIARDHVRKKADRQNIPCCLIFDG